VTAYYSYWGQYGHPPSTVDYSALTHIIHVGLEPSQDPPYYSKHPEFEIGWDRIKYQRDLIDRAHKSGVKVILALGSIASNYAFICSDERRLNLYLDSVLAYARDKGYDGVDVDWEYPKNSQEGKEHALLLKKLRSRLDAWKPKGTLTIAVSNDFRAVYEINALNMSCDQINLMNYDLAGKWNAFSGFNTPIYMPDDCQGYDGGIVSKGVGSWLERGLNSRRVGLGVSFLAYRWEGITSYCQAPHSGGMRTHYFEIVEKYLHDTGSTRHWNDKAQVPFIMNSIKKYFVSYDDSVSLKYKIDYAMSKNLGGVMIWELWEGYVPTNPPGSRDLLLQSIKKAVSVFR